MSNKIDESKFIGQNIEKVLANQNDYITLKKVTKKYLSGSDTKSLSISDISGILKLLNSGKNKHLSEKIYSTEELNNIFKIFTDEELKIKLKNKENYCTLNTLHSFTKNENDQLTSVENNSETVNIISGTSCAAPRALALDAKTYYSSSSSSSCSASINSIS